MQARAIEEGGAFALKVMSGNRLVQLVPITYQSKKITQDLDFSLIYEFTMPDGTVRKFKQDQIFHVRYGLSDDGLTGISVVKQSAEAIGLALQAELAAAKIFRNGMIVGGMLKVPGKLSPEAFGRLREQMSAREGSENAGKSMVLEEGMDYEAGAQTGRDAQGVEQRKFQIEEIARPFGVPRPLLGVDDTSWGSGIGVLGQFFVRYGLIPWFTAWEQAITRDLLSDAEADIYEAKFNASGLLRGSETEQGEFFAKALGSGGHAPWMAPAEVREVLDMPARDERPPPPGQQMGGHILNELAKHSRSERARHPAWRILSAPGPRPGTMAAHAGGS